MGVIRYAVPYEIRVIAKDLSSGRRTGCRQYLESAIQSDTTAPAYGAAIAGAGSTTTLLASFKTKWDAFVALMSVNYQMELLEMRAITGKQYASPMVGIALIGTNPTDTFYTTSSPHGFSNGQSVFVQGVTTPAGANGLKMGITRISATEFSAPGPNVGAYTGAGIVQRAIGQQQWIYEDKETLIDTTIGAITGDAVALFADASIVRANTGVGKSFRSRFSLAPIAESDVVDGIFTSGRQTAWNTALALLVSGYVNGGSDSTGGFSVPVAVSQKLAFLQTSPFASSFSWAKQITTMRLHPNMGSQVKRKVKVLG